MTVKNKQCYAYARLNLRSKLPSFGQAERHTRDGRNREIK